MSFESRVKDFTLISHLTYLDYLWYLILRGKLKKKEKNKTHLNTKFLPIFQMVGFKITSNIHFCSFPLFAYLTLSY